MKYNLLIVFLLLITIILFGCEKGIDNSEMGTLTIKLTDTPFPIDTVQEANVTINKIEIRKAQSESDGNPFLVLSEDEFNYNLLDLQNGITADLVTMEVPVGDYDLVRLYVSSASIKLKDETVYDLEVPSGDATGIKVFVDPSIRVVGGLTTELVLDFDVSQSFIPQGDIFTPAGISGFNFKPVIRAANISTSGSIEGNVLDSDSNDLEGASIWIEDNGNTYSASSDDQGYYMLPYIPAGTYTVNATKDDTPPYDTVYVENVEVIAGNLIQLDDIVLTQEQP